jgi:hypothetical protein
VVSFVFNGLRLAGAGVERLSPDLGDQVQAERLDLGQHAI